MGIKFNPGLKAAGVDPNLVENLIEAQKAPLNAAKARKEKIVTEKKEVEALEKKLSDLDTTLNALKTKRDFSKLKLDSSHPDIVDGLVSPGAMLGTYEMEVRSLARTEKELAYGFPDKDQTSVGFGYMLIERDDGMESEIIVEPGTTLQQLANQINESNAGVKAMVINTKYTPDSYRLLVTSEKSGKEARIYLDEDTTFLEFKEQVTGRNLDVLFEDVPITDEDNNLEDLIDAVSLTVRRSEPGTRVQISVVYDVEKTVESIKAFVEKYNEVAGFINSQFKENPETGQYGILAADSSIKQVIRQMQSALVAYPGSTSKIHSLVDIGITTNSKTGELNLDEGKLKQALASDYEAVAGVFIRDNGNAGVAEALAQKLKNFRDPGNGTVKSKLRGLGRIIENQDKDIERRSRLLESKEANIKRQFTALESQLASMKGQSDFLKARFAADSK